MTSTADSAPTTRVQFWFDPICPWAWMTSRWMLEVEKIRDVDIEFKVMSLAVLNEGRDLDADYMAKMERAKAPVRVVVAANELHGAQRPGLIRDLYTAIGTRIHPGGEGDYDKAVAGALEELGLPADLARHALSEDYDQVLEASHHEGIDRVGDDVGTPVIAVSNPDGSDGPAFFGPVMTPAPKGEEAGAVWDGVLAVSRYEGFYELKRSRGVGPIFD